MIESSGSSRPRFSGPLPSLPFHQNFKAREQFTTDSESLIPMKELKNGELNWKIRRNVFTNLSETKSYMMLCLFPKNIGKRRSMKCVVLVITLSS